MPVFWQYPDEVEEIMGKQPCELVPVFFLFNLVFFLLKNPWEAHIVSSKKFLRTSSSPHKTLPNDKNDAPKEVCCERKLFDSPLKK